jgi:hypothetical protein
MAASDDTWAKAPGRQTHGGIVFQSLGSAADELEENPKKNVGWTDTWSSCRGGGGLMPGQMGSGRWAIADRKAVEVATGDEERSAVLTL